MCYCRRCRERRRARANIKDHEQTAKVEFARDAARASSGTLAPSGSRQAPPPGRTAPLSRSGSFLDSPEFAQKLELRKQLAEAPPAAEL